MKSLILDLRGNAGGALVQAIEVSDLFLPKGDMIVSMKGRNRAFDREFPAYADDQYEKLPLVILIDQGSASASEIVGRGGHGPRPRPRSSARIPGARASSRQMFPLAPNMAVALTIAKYFTPSGRSIQRDYSQLDDYLLDKVRRRQAARGPATPAKGRKVLGQGGITPDYAVPFTLKAYTVRAARPRAPSSPTPASSSPHQTALGKTFVFPGRSRRADGRARS